MSDREFALCLIVATYVHFSTFGVVLLIMILVCMQTTSVSVAEKSGRKVEGYRV